jgi:hypothetical protein
MNSRAPMNVRNPEIRKWNRNTPSSKGGGPPFRIGNELPSNSKSWPKWLILLLPPIPNSFRSVPKARNCARNSPVFRSGISECTGEQIRVDGEVRKSLGFRCIDPVVRHAIKFTAKFLAPLSFSRPRGRLPRGRRLSRRFTHAAIEQPQDGLFTRTWGNPFHAPRSRPCRVVQLRPDGDHNVTNR